MDKFQKMDEWEEIDKQEKMNEWQKSEKWEKNERIYWGKIYKCEKRGTFEKMNKMGENG